MTAYADTSFLISLYGRDAHSPRAHAASRQYRPTFLLTPFGEAEFTNACEFRVFLKQWTAAKAGAVRDRFLSHLGIGIFQAQELTPEVWQMAVTISRRHTAKMGVRTLDVVHVATAVVLKPDAFFTFDDRQRKLAKAEGLRVLPA
ncbi:MAG: type II toxin-antitoxin system VapC family toxin [Terriglobia bacterium]